MRLPWRRHGPSTRGQSLVEFALALPVIVLLLVLALDFGRVFFGWVALNNVVRVAASDAGANADAWDPNGAITAAVRASKKADYRREVMEELQGIGCAPVSGGSWSSSDIPDPTFVNLLWSADPYEPGDHVKLQLSCDFSFLTPIVGNIVGNPMTISASAEFPVTAGLVLGVPFNDTGDPPTEGGECVVPNVFGVRALSAEAIFRAAGFTGTFTITRPPNGNYTITGQEPASGLYNECDAPIEVYGK